MKNIIRINKATFYAYHGVFRSEQNIGGKFEADIEIHTNFSKAAESDSLKKTIDYESVYKVIYELAMSKKFYLIESLASTIVKTIYDGFSNIDKIIVRVRKNNPPIGGVVDNVEVEVEMGKQDF
ncbi:MAG: dihydroneopterin aldolase [Ignavibacteriaceae bacterium]|nr:dihydroneopterin aldolase [Ignavibacteriaceae bacterium]